MTTRIIDMTDVTARTTGAATAAGLFAKLEVDTRLVGMIAVLAIIWIVFHVWTGGAFMTARNLWNLAVQTSVVGVMAAGMVFVLVTRHVDLSVGSLLGFVGMIVAVVQAEWLPGLIGLGHGATWIVAVLTALALGAALGGLQGAIIAYTGVPSFIVTLGGLLIWRGAAWWVTSGRTVAPMDERFQVIGGGITGSIGATPSLIVGALLIAGVVIGAFLNRRRRVSFGFPVKPVWAEIVVTGSVVAGIVGFVAVMNAFPLPAGVAAEVWARQGVVIPPGAPVPEIARGIPVPVLIMIGVALVMAFVAGRTPFGRAVYAIGGNPDAAKLAGIDVKRMTIAIFAIMGLLAAVAACIATARLNAGANASGTLAELTTIAAAVIGGTSLAGGIGTVAGALLGALVMQSLTSGMVLVGVDTPMQNIVIGIVLIAAVWADRLYQGAKS
jgi:D-xylose transport system permease protein